MTLNQGQIQHIIMLHGLGYNQQEVANKIGYSRSTVAYYLHKFKKKAEENGIDDTFWSYFSIDSLSKAMYSRDRQERREFINKRKTYYRS